MSARARLGPAAPEPAQASPSPGHVGPKGVGEEICLAGGTLIYSFTRQPGSAKHRRPLKD